MTPSSPTDAGVDRHVSPARLEKTVRSIDPMPPFPGVRPSNTGDALSQVAARLHDQVSRWPRAMWAGTTPAGRRRDQAAHELVQRLADLDAQVEGQPRRAVPWLGSEGAVTDQMMVMVADLIMARSPDAVLAAAIDLIERAHAELTATTLTQAH